MALLTRRPAPPGSTIPPLADHPQYQRLATLWRALLAAQASRQNETDLLLIESEIQRPSGGSSRGPRMDMLRDRAQKLRDAIPKKAEAPPPSDGLPPAASRAVALIQGAKVATPQDRSARLQTLRAEIAEIEAGVREVANLLGEAKADLTAEMAGRLLASHRAALAAIYEAAVVFSAAVQSEREIVVGLLNAGYDAAEHILQRPGFPAASRVGSLSEHDSELSFFRRRLEAQGVL